MGKIQREHELISILNGGVRMYETVVAKGLLSFGATFLGKESGQLVKSKISMIDKKFYKAVEKVSSILEVKYPHVLGGTTISFFTKKDFIEKLIKLLFKKTTIDIEIMYEHFDRETLPTEFLEEFIFLLKEELLKDPLFDAIFSDIDIYKKINSIEEILKGQVDVFSFDDFLNNYKKTLMNNISQINFFGLSLSSEVKKARRLLEDIYVLPRLSIKKDNKLVSRDLSGIKVESDEDDLNIDLEINIDEQEFFEQLEHEDEIITFDDLLNKLVSEDRHLVILGNPGAGKSILLKYCMFFIMSDKTSHPIKDYIPFRVELRKFLAYKRQNNKNITDYIFDNLILEYGIKQLSKRDLEGILSTRNHVLLFDGLDEIFHINDKLEIKNDIENFLLTHEKSKGIVTSRSIGYEETKLNENFLEVGMLEFNDDQIEEYVKKWYKENEENKKIMNEEVSSFLELTKELDGELSRNPLSLSLIVILYRNNGKLPNSKLEIYRGCTNTLVEEWDDNKELKFELAVKNKKVRIFTQLAYWQYIQLSGKQKKNNSAITNITVLNEVSNIISAFKNVAEDEFEAEKFAKEFLSYAQKRSIYFDNNFTHKTFHEYYTALCIYQNSDAKGKFEQRNEIIKKYITNSFWVIVLELLISMIDERQGDDEVLSELIETQWSYSDDIKVNYFFLTIINQIKNVGEHIVIRLLKESIKQCINLVDLISGPDDSDKNKDVHKVFREISKLNKNKKYNLIIKNCLAEIYDEIKSTDTLLLRYYTFLYELDSKINSDQEKDVVRLAQSNRLLYEKFYRNDNKFLEDTLKYIDIFGEQDLFVFRISGFDRALILPYIFHYIYNEVHKNGDKNSIKENLNKLSSKGVNLERLLSLYDNFSEVINRNVPINHNGLFKEALEEVSKKKVSS